MLGEVRAGEVKRGWGIRVWDDLETHRTREKKVWRQIKEPIKTSEDRKRKRGYLENYDINIEPNRISSMVMHGEQPEYIDTDVSSKEVFRDSGFLFSLFILWSS